MCKSFFFYTSSLTSILFGFLLVILTEILKEVQFPSAFP